MCCLSSGTSDTSTGARVTQRGTRFLGAVDVARRSPETLRRSGVVVVVTSSLSLSLQFADWCMNYGKHGCRTPDTPFSLFEGNA